jgi:hypothetical protein
MITEPLDAMLAKANMINDALELVSSVEDCPQKAVEKPQ